MRFDDDQFVFSLQWRGPCHDTRAQSCQKEKFGFGPSSVRNKSAHSYDSLRFESPGPQQTLPIHNHDIGAFVGSLTIHSPRPCLRRSAFSTNKISSSSLRHPDIMIGAFGSLTFHSPTRASGARHPVSRSLPRTCTRTCTGDAACLLTCSPARLNLMQVFQ